MLSTSAFSINPPMGIPFYRVLLVDGDFTPYDGIEIADCVTVAPFVSDPFRAKVKIDC